jgi:hypothetical protein
MAMPVKDKIDRFVRMNRNEKIASILRHLNLKRKAENLKFHRLITGTLALPSVLRSSSRLYIAWRPDSDVIFDAFPELRFLSDNWVSNNILNNAGDLSRLYALALNIKQVMSERIEGDFAELGVYRGNSAAVLAHYARKSNRSVFLFDTFQGFEEKDLTGIDSNKKSEFADTSLDMVQKNVGEEAVTFIKGYFPGTVTKDVSERRFAVVHLDCDLYEPMKAGLEFFYPRLSPGGLIIMHDYSGIYWDGIKRAVDEYGSQIVEGLILMPDKSGTAMIRKAR